ncbi:MAG TPA: hypothetical protein VII01_04100 [Solirubrobacteraceae bacterium]
MIELQHARMLVTAAEAVRVFPFAGLSAVRVNGRAGVSRKAFDDHLEGREACLLAAFEQALALAGARASAAFQAQEGWVDRMRAGLLALLEFFDEEPALARYCVVYSAQVGPAVLARRSEVLDRLALVLDDGRAPARGYPPPLTAEAVVSGVLGVLHGRLRKLDPGVLVELSNPLMSGRSVALDLPQDPGKRHRAMRVLSVIGAEPGLNNREVALRAGAKDQGHISRLLARLARRGLVENTRTQSRKNVWQLTASGKELDKAIRHENPDAARLAR